MIQYYILPQRGHLRLQQLKPYLVKGNMIISIGGGKKNLNRKEILNLMVKKITTGWYSYSRTLFCKKDMYLSGQRRTFSIEHLQVEFL